jgi:hypothetical protein
MNQRMRTREYIEQELIPEGDRISRKHNIGHHNCRPVIVRHQNEHRLGFISSNFCQEENGHQYAHIRIYSTEHKFLRDVAEKCVFNAKENVWEPVLP